ncbi:nuclear transport factor 2 family protein [Sphingomonas sp.]|uniref:nuclear transport factor 2 family protein n=1 Tax=Sphingomonas sp. TaxID=28214 RepID=UPI002DD6955E|nr:nuclear transport factor 2 family protein [Sphingomonas sp.]
MPLLLALLLQTTPVQPLPKAIPLPPPDAETAAVLAPVERMFAAITAKDAPTILAQTRPGGRATAVIAMPDGSQAVRARSWADFAEGLRDGPERLEERLINPVVEIDGDIAMIWSSYVFFADGRLTHCGTNHVDLIRDAGGWKVHNLTWTQRSTDCPAP